MKGWEYLNRVGIFYIEINKYEVLQNYWSSWDLLLTYSMILVLKSINDPWWLRPEILPKRFISLTWLLSFLIFLELGHIHSCLWSLAVTHINHLHLVPLCCDQTLHILGPICCDPTLHIQGPCAPSQWSYGGTSYLYFSPCCDHCLTPATAWSDHSWSYIPEVNLPDPCLTLWCDNYFHTRVSHHWDTGVSIASLRLLYC